MTFRIFLTLVCALVAGAGLSYWLVALGYRWRVRRRSAQNSPSQLPSVSILKPLKGLDDELEANLRSFFELDYPRYELLFGLNDPDDPAIEIVQRLRGEYPKVSARLVVDENRVGPNPKVNNLVNLYPHCRNEVIVINDSNTRVIPGYLQPLIAALWQPGVGLATSPIRGVGGSALGAQLENLQLNTFVAGSIPILGELFGVPITIGKSMAIRRETLERVGGFVTLRNYLAEDDQLGKAVQRLEFTVARAAQSIDNVNVSWPLSRYLKRQTRWAMMRRYTTLGHYLVEPSANPLPWALLAYIFSPGIFGTVVLSVTAGIKILVDWSLLRAHDAPRNLSTLILIPVKDILIPFIWIAPLFLKTVAWRGHTFRIGPETEVELIDEHPGDSDQLGDVVRASAR